MKRNTQVHGIVLPKCRHTKHKAWSVFQANQLLLMCTCVCSVFICPPVQCLKGSLLFSPPPPHPHFCPCLLLRLNHLANTCHDLICPFLFGNICCSFFSPSVFACLLPYTLPQKEILPVTDRKDVAQGVWMATCPADLSSYWADGQREIILPEEAYFL